MRLGRFIRSLQVHVPPSLTAICQPLPVSLKVGRTIYNGSFSASRDGQKAAKNGRSASTFFPLLGRWEVNKRECCGA